MKHEEGGQAMLKRINAVNVCGTISFMSMIAMVGFADGGNYIASVISLVLFAGFAYIALKEDGAFRKKNRPR